MHKSCELVTQFSSEMNFSPFLFFFLCLLMCSGTSHHRHLPLYQLLWRFRSDVSSTSLCMFDESFYATSGIQAWMWEILSGKKVQKMGGVQVCNEGSKHLLAHEQTRASVMSVQRETGGVGAEKRERIMLWTWIEPQAVTSAVQWALRGRKCQS